MKLRNLNAEMLSLRQALDTPFTTAEDARQAHRVAEIQRKRGVAEALPTRQPPSTEPPRDR